MDINQLILNSEKLEHITPKGYILGTIKTNYQNTVRSTIKLKHPRMDGIMNNYMEKSDNNDPSFIRVDMNDWKIIDFWDNQNEEVIYTFWLWGCIATALVLEMEDWIQKALMTHYDPFGAEFWASKFTNSYLDMLPWKIKNARFFVVAPGERQDIKMVVNKSCENDVNLYVNSVKKLLWQELKIDKIWYSMSLSINSKNQWTFRIVKWIDNKLKFIVGHYISYWDVF